MRKRDRIKKINKEIFDHVVSAICFTIMLIALAIIVTHRFIESNILKTYWDSGFTIQINPKFNKELESLTDIEGLNMKSNVINITNNNTEDKTYKVILTPLSEEDGDIRIALDNYLVRNLGSFEKEENYYILMENELVAGMTNSHTVRMWQDKKAENKKINVDFKLEIKILN